MKSARCLKAVMTMIMYKPISKAIKNGVEETLSTQDTVIGFKTAYSYFHVWKSGGYTILEAYIELYDNGEKIDTIKVDISKIM